jgi:AraC family transcriptional regulator
VIAQPLERASSQTATAAVHGFAVERVLATMRERLDEDLTLHVMADVARLSPYHFTRVFRHVTGIPPCEFLTALRLQEAKRLLLTTGLSVTDVCFEVGYSSLGTFTTRFTHLIGPAGCAVSPRPASRHTPRRCATTMHALLTSCRSTRA